MKQPAAKAQIDSFVSKYTPEIAAQLRHARTKLRALFPRGYELVYDNYNALVFGFGATERASDALVSVAGYPKWVTLFFLKGAGLRDPHRLLKGAGTQVCSIQLASPKDLDKPEILALIAQAVQPHLPAFAAAPRLSTILKSVSKKQRPRRPATAANTRKAKRPHLSSRT